VARQMNGLSPTFWIMPRKWTLAGMCSFETTVWTCVSLVKTRAATCHRLEKGSPDVKATDRFVHNMRSQDEHRLSPERMKRPAHSIFIPTRLVLFECCESTISIPNRRIEAERGSWKWKENPSLHENGLDPWTLDSTFERLTVGRELLLPLHTKINLHKERTVCSGSSYVRWVSPWHAELINIAACYHPQSYLRVLCLRTHIAGEYSARELVDTRTHSRIVELPSVNHESLVNHIESGHCPERKDYGSAQATAPNYADTSPPSKYLCTFEDEFEAHCEVGTEYSPGRRRGG
jgi:hypothetical protein